MKEDMFKHILVAADDSGPAKTAFLTARRLADQLGATLTVVHVADPVRETVPPTIPSSGLASDFSSGFGATLTTWCKELPGNIPVPEMIVKTGNPGHIIHDLTTSMRWDLVVMGTKSREGLRAFLGSVAEDVLKHSDVPVLVVRDKKV